MISNFSIFTRFANYSRIILLFIAFHFLSVQLCAQISQGGKPVSFALEMSTEDEIAYSPSIPFILSKNESVSKQCTAYEFGKILPLNLSLKNKDFGTKIVDIKGNTIWKATIASKNALALGLYFSDFYLPKGAKLFIYSPDKEQVIGAFTDLNNSKSGLFATELIIGDELIIEYYEPASVTGQGRFNIDEVLHAFRGVNDLKESSGWRGSGACEVNVNCSEGTNYVKQRNSVVRILVKEGTSSYWCTGSVVNNTNNDLKPYILTADHCGTDATTANLSQWIFYFNYQSTTCATPITEPSTLSITGCTKIAASSNAGILGSDFYLVLLNQNIPDNYNAYFMGWDRRGDGSTNGTSIHHPQGDIKKISTYTTSLLTATYSSGGLTGLTNGSWEVVWSVTINGHGVTEGGSSGSPIYSQDGFLIGTLTGGWASCTALTQPDYYGKFSYHWEMNGTSANTQLKPWLDPLDTRTTYLSGTAVGIEETPKRDESFFSLFPNPSNGVFTLQFGESVNGKSYNILVSNILGQIVYSEKIVINYQLDVNLQHLQKGVYFIQIEGENKKQTQKILIQ